jgi:hypothetical protein
MTRKRILLFSLLLLVLGAALWLWSQRVRRVDMARYVPEAALGYLEINNWPQTAERLTATKAWKELAPAYGIADGRAGVLNYAGTLGGLAQYAGPLGGEAALLARAQFALVVTSLEVRGEGDSNSVKPRWALLAEAHTSESTLRAAIAKRLPELAQRAFGATQQDIGVYEGISITALKAADQRSSDPNEIRQLLSAQVGSLWLVANHPEALRACLDTRLGRKPALADNAALKQARQQVLGTDDVFGFITGDGLTRLLRFGTYVLTGGPAAAIGKAMLAGAVGDVLTEFSTRSAEGLAYGVSFEQDFVVDRYALLLKPDLLTALNQGLKVNAQPARVLDLIPAGAREVTVIRLENPATAFTEIEKAISARVNFAQSFLLKQFLNSVQESFFGLRRDDNLAAVLGNEAASLNFTSDVENRLWLLSLRNETLARPLLARLLGNPRRETRAGVELLDSGSDVRGAAAFVNGFLAVGKRAELIKLIEAQRATKLTQTPPFTAAFKPPQTGITLSYASAKEETATLMHALARRVNDNAPQSVPALDSLPLMASVTSLNAQAVLNESYAPLGSFPLFFELVRGMTYGE